MVMEVVPRGQPVRAFEGPLHDYEVIFWRQPLVDAGKLPGGVAQERVAWAAAEYDVRGVRDVVEVLEWAYAEARARRSIFSLFALKSAGDRETIVWIGGWNPTSSGSNFERRLPPDVDPVSGTPLEVYGPRADGSETDRPPLV